MTPAAFRDALGLPGSTDVNRRVPKTAFLEQIKGIADRKQFDTLVERLDWLASLSPSSVGVAASGGAMPVDELQLFALTARRDPPQRLLQVIHQALPYPLALITHWPQAPASRLSLLSTHTAAAQLVSVDLLPGEALDAFRASLALQRLPRTDLAALYDGLMDRARALIAAQIAGGAFRLPSSPHEAEARKQALAAFRACEASYRSIKSAAAKEKRLAHAVELGNKARKAKIALDSAIKALL